MAFSDAITSSDPLIPFPPLSLSPQVWGKLGAPTSPPSLCPGSSQYGAGTRWGWDSRRSDLSTESPGSAGRALPVVCSPNVSLFMMLRDNNYCQYQRGWVAGVPGFPTAGRGEGSMRQNVTRHSHRGWGWLA